MVVFFLLHTIFTVYWVLRTVVVLQFNSPHDKNKMTKTWVWSTYINCHFLFSKLSIFDIPQVQRLAYFVLSVHCSRASRQIRPTIPFAILFYCRLIAADTHQPTRMGLMIRLDVNYSQFLFSIPTVYCTLSLYTPLCITTMVTEPKTKRTKYLRGPIQFY